MLRRLASGAALVAAAAMVLVGCTPPEPTETTPSVSTAPTSTPSAADDVTLTDRAFTTSARLLELVDQGFREGVLPADEMRGVATDELIAMIEADLAEFQGQGLRISGSSGLDSPSIVSNDPTSETDGSLVLATCWDTSDTTTTNADGEVVSGGVTRQPRLFELVYTASDITVIRTGPPASTAEVPGCE